MTDQPDPIGPFVPASDPAEQLTRLRSLPAPVVIFGGPHHRLVLALALDETDPDQRRGAGGLEGTGTAVGAIKAEDPVLAGDIDAHRWNGADEWGEEARMIDPYAELKLTAQRMEADGVSPDLVIDALLCVGLNAANRLHGPEFVIAHLHKLIEVFEEKARKQAPPPPTPH